jgi:hypothetical protein
LRFAGILRLKRGIFIYNGGLKIMAIDIGKYTLSSIDMVRIYDIGTKELLAILDEMKDGTFENSGNTVWATGKDGVRLAGFDKEKASKFSGNNGFIVGGLLSIQSGSDAEVADTEATILTEAFEIIEVSDATKVTTTYKAEGAVGAEIPFIYSVNKDNTQGKKYAQGATASASVFAYSPTTKEITLPTGAFDVGDRVMVSYNYLTKGIKYTNNANGFSKDCYAVFDITAHDPCDKTDIYTKLVMSRGKVDMNYSIALGGDPAVHALAIEAIASVCGGKKEFWNWVFPFE